MTISRDFRKAVQAAFEEVFDPETFRLCLREARGKEEELFSDLPLVSSIFFAIESASLEGWFQDLLSAAVKLRSGDQRLSRLLERWAVESRPTPEQLAFEDLCVQAALLWDFERNELWPIAMTKRLPPEKFEELLSMCIQIDLGERQLWQMRLSHRQIILSRIKTVKDLARSVESLRSLGYGNDLAEKLLMDFIGAMRWNGRSEPPVPQALLNIIRWFQYSPQLARELALPSEEEVSAIIQKDEFIKSFRRQIVPGSLVSSDTQQLTEQLEKARIQAHADGLHIIASLPAEILSAYLEWRVVEARSQSILHLDFGAGGVSMDREAFVRREILSQLQAQERPVGEDEKIPLSALFSKAGEQALVVFDTTNRGPRYRPAHFADASLLVKAVLESGPGRTILLAATVGEQFVEIVAGSDLLELMFRMGQGQDLKTAWLKRRSQGQRREEIGKVTSDKMQKTIVVKVERRAPHPVFKKVVTRSCKRVVHDPKESARVGDIVRIKEIRPLSRLKRWTLCEIISRAASSASKINHSSPSPDLL